MAPYSMEAKTFSNESLKLGAKAKKRRSQWFMQKTKVHQRLMRLKMEMKEISEEQKNIREGQRQVREKFESIESECEQLRRETTMLIKQSAIIQVRLASVGSMLQAMKECDFAIASKHTQLLRKLKKVYISMRDISIM
ncbi:hypothetical protein CRYUN_Cryun06bG0008000 [Craigia yunnanensis]